MKYLLHTIYTSLLIFGLYSLYEETASIISSQNTEPFFSIIFGFIFIITGIIGITFTRKSIISGITAVAGSLLLTFGLAVSAREIDASLNGVSESPIDGYILSLVFLIIGLNIIIYGFKIKYLLYTTYTVLIIFGLYSLYGDTASIIGSQNTEPFFSIIFGFFFVITGIIGITFTRKSIISGITAVAGSLLLTFGLAVSAIEIDANLNGISENPILAHMVALIFLGMGLKTIIYGSNINQNAKNNA